MAPRLNLNIPNMSRGGDQLGAMKFSAIRSASMLRVPVLIMSAAFLTPALFTIRNKKPIRGARRRKDALNTGLYTMTKIKDETAAEYIVTGKRGKNDDDAIIAAAIKIVEKRLRKNRDPSQFNITKSDDAINYVRLRFAECETEHFWVMFLNTRHDLISCDVLFTGTIDACSIYPRVIIQQALAKNAAAIIVGHNHPSGNPDPSRADVAITAKIVDACRTVDIRVLDHLVVGENVVSSLATLASAC